MESDLKSRSTPLFTEFNPCNVPFQSKVVDDIDSNLDFSLGTWELLLSGSVGSAKTTLAAHIIIKHALKYPKNIVGIGRKSLVDLKSTLFRAICDQLEDPNVAPYIEKIVYNTAQIYLTNGSIIEGISWTDQKFAKFRSRVYSLFVFEEAIENDGVFAQAFIECRQRVGRLPHVPKSMIIYCTNPAGKSHPLYKYFFTQQSPTRKVYFSLTEQNPFLPKTYIEQLKRDLPPKEAQRNLYGQWVDLDQERIYYAYNSEINFKKETYNIRNNIPISISFDFNIAAGKPMSAVLSQYDLSTDTFHFFDEIIIHGSRTEDICDELSAKGYLDMNVSWEIHGDATGGARSTNSKLSNYDIILQFFSNYRGAILKANFMMLVPKSNPPIRERHNIVNAYCTNTLGEKRLFVYQKAKTLHEGMLMTALKKGAEYIEDDSKEWQHSTTALGYRVAYTSKNKVISQGRNL